MATETEFAPAKVNLCLHVTGQRGDGYHLLDSLVAFAEIGDRVTVTPGQGFSITGPQAAHLDLNDDNLCQRAARAMGGGVAITLDKHLPIASGIGGGSADAAATLRAMARLGRPMPDAAAILKLGADVPVCLSGRPTRMSGVGEVLAPVTLPPAWMVLANPGQSVSTPDVFRALTRRDNAPMQPMSRLRDLPELAAWLVMQRNDLEPPATQLAPVIAQVHAALTAQSDCHFARMSGSGATCYGLFPDGLTATAAARALQTQHPDWWVAAGRMLS
jgi:4-diphosphocytidyl-2-C-methyl-D-erythritol kinase